MKCWNSIQILGGMRCCLLLQCRLLHFGLKLATCQFALFTPPVPVVFLLSDPNFSLFLSILGLLGQSEEKAILFKSLKLSLLERNLFLTLSLLPVSQHLSAASLCLPVCASRPPFSHHPTVFPVFSQPCFCQSNSSFWLDQSFSFLAAISSPSPA